MIVLQLTPSVVADRVGATSVINTAVSPVGLVLAT